MSRAAPSPARTARSPCDGVGARSPHSWQGQKNCPRPSRGEPAHRQVVSLGRLQEPSVATDQAAGHVDGVSWLTVTQSQLLPVVVHQIKVGRRGADGFSRLRSRFCGSVDHSWRECLVLLPLPRWALLPLTTGARNGLRRLGQQRAHECARRAAANDGRVLVASTGLRRPG